jgi:molecular chaperone DnaK (HSP70)
MSLLGPLKALSLDERKIAVAIDFGTTFSGVAWAKVLDVRCPKPPLLVRIEDRLLTMRRDM